MAAMQSSNQAYFSSRESFIAQETFKLFVSSWNVGGIPPPDNLNLDELLNIENSMADIYVFGFQEIVPLNVGNILVPENTNISMKWNTLIRAALNRRTVTEDRPQKEDVGEMQRIHPLRTQNSINSTSPDFQCVAWEIRHEKERNTDTVNILERTQFPAEAFQHLPRKILDHDQVIWLGGLNYRIYLPGAQIRSLVKGKECRILLENDQLKVELTKGRVFEGWHEKEIDFAPTYKYDQNSDDYCGSDHKMKARRMKAPA
ncbi:hypothetical protein CDL12_05445 [Handroanthus impetiginosus]|uniref:Inositol polyphosphate-related phosphatase domain-containing protein n=1 Tax=Handroanthus impetiginosus TaxID=429701 RepID=A0A2G9HWE9_9LAMI|nr:hypothetical protein CDL12_05445 [Handroanthus impetiginosus]